MNEEKNKAFIREIFDSLNAGDPTLWIDRMSDDIVFSIIGTTKFSGVFNGKKDFLTRAMGVMQTLVEPGSASLRIENLIAEGDYVVMLAEGAARTRTGQDHNNTYAMIFTIKDDKIVEIKEFIDTALVDRIFGPA